MENSKEGLFDRISKRCRELQGKVSFLWFGEKLDKTNLLKEKNLMTQQCFRICSKLNLKTTDFVCYSGNGVENYLFPDIVDCVKGIVINETNVKIKTYLQNNRKLKNIKFIDNIGKLDKSAFDKVIYFYNEFVVDGRDGEMINHLINATDNKGMVLVSGIPRDIGSDMFLNFLSNKGISNVWLMRNELRERFDLVFKVEKY